MSDRPEWRDVPKTRVTGETYDDDPGTEGLGVPRRWDTSTKKTSNDSDTYDEIGIFNLVTTPVELSGSSWFTKVEGETYDDDPGLGGLSSPNR